MISRRFGIELIDCLRVKWVQLTGGVARLAQLGSSRLENHFVIHSDLIAVDDEFLFWIELNWIELNWNDRIGPSNLRAHLMNIQKLINIEWFNQAAAQYFMQIQQIIDKRLICIFHQLIHFNRFGCFKDASRMLQGFLAEDAADMQIICVLNMNI